MLHIEDLYRTIIPEKIRVIIYAAFLGELLQSIRGLKRKMKFIKYKLYYTVVTPKTEKEKNIKKSDKELCFSLSLLLGKRIYQT